MEKYKKNPLSLQPGGHSVIFKYANGGASKHSNIKSVRAYKNKMEKVKGSEVIAVIYADSPATPAPIKNVNQVKDTEAEAKYNFYRKYYNLI